MHETRVPEQPSFSSNEVIRERLEKDWILRDKLQSECNVVEKISEYHRNQKITDALAGDDDVLILQRTIGFSCMAGNEQWIAKSECYICEKYQLTFFLYKPETRIKTQSIVSE